MHTKLIKAFSVDADIRDHLLIIYSVIIRHMRKKQEYNGTVNKAFIDPNKAYDSINRGFI
jgi:hypothetical protein